MTLLDNANSIKQQIIDNRRYIHQNAEVGEILPQTTAYVVQKLEQMGYTPKMLCDSGIEVIAGGKKEGKTFLIRADMDALPMKEETGLPFACTTGKMHSCGHDTHTAMLLGAAQLLKDHEEEIEGTIKLMFQPNEEGGTGAKLMIDAGVLENPKVDAAMMIHIGGLSLFPQQKQGEVAVILNHGKMASSDMFEIEICGKGGHGAMPETAIDPINIGAHIILAMQAINARETAGPEVCVLTFGKFIAGDAANIIPDKAILAGTIRTLDKTVREKVNKRLVEIAESTAKVFGGTATVKITMAIATLVSNSELVDELAGYVKQICPPQQVVVATQNIMGSEDFAEVADRVPAIIIGVAAPRPEKEYNYPQHHPRVDFNEDALPIGAAIYAQCALQWLKNNK